MSGPPSDRMLTQEFTPEFLREFVPLDEAEAALEDATRRFEDSYNAVAWVEENTDYYTEKGYRVRVIGARSADMDALQHGMQHIHHWLMEDP